MRVPAIVVRKLFSTANVAVIADYLCQLRLGLVGERGVFRRYHHPRAHLAAGQGGNLMASAAVSLDQVVNAMVSAQAKPRLARLFDQGCPRLGFRICGELGEWGVTMVLADFPNLICGLDEYRDIDYYQGQFQVWVQTGLANQIDFDKSQTLKYSRFGDLLGFYIWKARSLSKNVDKLQLQYHGIESQLEICEIVKSIEQVLQPGLHKSSSLLPYPTSKAESADLLRVCNDKICSLLGEEKWSRIVRHLGLPRDGNRARQPW